MYFKASDLVLGPLMRRPHGIVVGPNKQIIGLLPNVNQDTLFLE